MNSLRDKNNVYVVEHLDPELGPWSALEYAAIAAESAATGASFCLSSVPSNLELPHELQQLDNLVVENESVEELFRDCKDRVCLLDPRAESELSPSDVAKFDVFVIGGILGTVPPGWEDLQ
ncbi:MAG: hypothetical protein Q9190_006029 [Brigantiaea leucoxantha]